MRRIDWLILLLAASVVAHIALLVLLPDDGWLVETLYARGLYPALGPIVAWLPSLLPFSLALTLLAALAVVLPVYLAGLLVRWRRRGLAGRTAIEHALLTLIAVLACLFHSYYLFWGYNYFRPPLEARLGLATGAIPAGLQRAYARRFIEEALAARVEVEEWSLDELDRLVDRAIADAMRTLELRQTPVVSPLKGDMGTGLLSLFGTRGVVSANTLEAHIDPGLPAFQLPFTAAHEKAHLAGFARERDANFVAWLALTRAEDPRLRYAGYFGLFGYFLSSDLYPVAGPLLEDRAELRRYTSARVSEPVQRAGRRAYNSYLRANRMPSGTGDYSEVSKLILAWELRRG